MRKKGNLSRWYKPAKGLMALALVALFLFTAMPNLNAVGDVLEGNEDTQVVQEIPGEEASAGEEQALETTEQEDGTPSDEETSAEEKEEAAIDESPDSGSGHDMTASAAELENSGAVESVAGTEPSAPSSAPSGKEDSSDDKSSSGAAQNEDSLAAIAERPPVAATGLVAQDAWLPILDAGNPFAIMNSGEDTFFSLVDANRTTAEDGTWSLEIQYTWNTNTPTGENAGVVPVLFHNAEMTEGDQGTRQLASAGATKGGIYTEEFTGLKAGATYYLSAEVNGTNLYPESAFVVRSLTADAESGTANAAQSEEVGGNRSRAYDVYGSYLTFYSNDGRGLTGGLYIPRLEWHPLPHPNTMWGNRPGYEFSHWSVTSHNNGSGYAAGHSWMGAGAGGQFQNLYAIWKESTPLTITYYPNGGTGDVYKQSVYSGQATTTYNGAGFSNPGHTLKGWSYSAGGSIVYSLGGSITTVMNLSLYAVWERTAPQQVTITYNPNNGNGSGRTVTQDSGTTHTVLSQTNGRAGTRTGYSFLGWSTAFYATSAQYVEGNTFTPVANVTLYAVWKQDTPSYTVTYSAGTGGTGGTTLTDQTSPHTVLSQASAGVTRSGYTFKGWSTTNGATTAQHQPGDKLTLTGNITLYAVWEQNAPTTYTVTYSAGTGGTGGTTLANQTSPHTVLTQASAGVSRDGYTFKGWSTTNGATTAQHQPGDKLTLTGNITLYAVWAPSTYTVTYSAGTGGTGGTTLTNQTSPHTVLTQASAGVSRDGYTFKGWATSDGAATAQYQPGAELTLTGNITLYAVWELATPSTYTISYNGNGGTGSVAEQTVTAGSMVVLAPRSSFTRPGYTLTSWNTSASGNGTSYVPGGQIRPNRSMTLYAQWEPEAPSTYTISYNGNGGTGGVAAQTVSAGEQVTLANGGFTRSDYTLTRWNTRADGSGTSYALGATIRPDQSMTLYAIWETVELTYYTISYNGNGGTGSVNPQTVVAGNMVVLASRSSFSRPGYTLTRWNTNPNGSGDSYVPGAQIRPSRSMTLYAQWEPEAPSTYTISYHANGGTGGVAAQTVAIGSQLTLADGGFTREGFTLQGWNTSAGGAGTFYGLGETITPPRSMTLYAVWVDSSPRTVTYHPNGANTSSGMTGRTVYITGGEHTILSRYEARVANRSGYQFVGWSESASATNPTYRVGDIATFTQSHTDLYAIWAEGGNGGGGGTVMLYWNREPAHWGGVAGPVEGLESTLVDQNGQVLHHISIKFRVGESHTVLTPEEAGFIVLPGYRFLYWITNYDNQVYPGQVLWEDKSIIYYPILEKVTEYTVRYHSQGGDGPGREVTVPTTQATHTVLDATLANIGIRPGYDFMGWSLYPGSMVVHYSPGSQLENNKDYDLYAVWDKIPDRMYTIEYDPNGGTGSITAQTVTAGDSIYLSDGGNLARTGHRLTGWSVWPGSGGKTYALGEEITPGGDMILYAQWERTHYTVTYEAGTGSGTGITISEALGDEHEVLDPAAANVVAPSGHYFSGWSLDGGINIHLLPGMKQLFPIDVTMTAVWEAESTFTFEPNTDHGGQGPPLTVRGLPSDVMTFPDAYEFAFIHEHGRRFLGWDTDKDAIQPQYSVGGTMLYGDLNGQTLYAIWSRAVVVTVRYEDEAGIELLPAYTHNGQVGDPYSPRIPEIEGHSYKHWYLDSDTTPVLTPPEFTDLQSNFTVTLVYEKSKYAVRIYHLDLEGNELDAGLIEGFDTNPTRHYTNEDSWAVPGVVVRTYEAKYYTLANSQGAEKLPMDRPVDLTGGGRDWTLYVYYVSTEITISYPAHMEFYSNETDPGTVWSPTYSFGNTSQAALDVYFVKLGASSLVQDGLTITGLAQNPNEIHLTLEGEGNAFANTALPGGAGGLEPNQDYAAATGTEGLPMGSLKGLAYSGGNTYAEGSFSIGGHYEGLLSTEVKRPRVEFSFHFALAEYEP